MPTLLSRHFSVRIERPFDEVYAFVARPENMTRWAAGLSAGLERRGDVFVGHGPDGRPIEVRFAPPNAFGVVDHDVTLPDGAVVHVPLRVIANGDGSEVVLTMFRQPWMSDADVEADAKAVEKDLAALEALLSKA